MGSLIKGGKLPHLSSLTFDSAPADGLQAVVDGLRAAPTCGSGA